jgi:hypothetical protein
MSKPKRSRIIQGRKTLIFKRATKKKWCHSYLEVTAVKNDLSHREDVFCIPHTKQILLSDLEVFGLTDGLNYGLVIGVAIIEREAMVVYIVSLKQCSEISRARQKTHLDSLKKAEMLKPTAKRYPTKKPDVFNIYN